MVENLTLSEISADLVKRVKINNTIINNASLETSHIKRSFGDRILAFFSIYLTAALLSSFVLYDYLVQKDDIAILKYFFFILSGTVCILTCYCVVVYGKFYNQYLRQMVYRDINNEIAIIQCNIKLFFFSTGKDYVSLTTLNDFFDLLKDSCYQKNKYKYVSCTMFREWTSIFIAMFFFGIMTIVTLLLGVFYG